MIVDFLLMFYYGTLDLVVSTLPPTPSWSPPDILAENAGVQLLKTANYFFPIQETLQLLFVFSGLYATVLAVRWVFKLIPGIG